ncbi:MAG: hypothetical protein ABSD57_06210 [Verrucomicrobiota bacterium]
MAPPDFAYLAERNGAILLACKFLGEVEMAREVGEGKDASGFESAFKPFAPQAEPKLVGVGCQSSLSWHRCVKE